MLNKVKENISMAKIPRGSIVSKNGQLMQMLDLSMNDKPLNSAYNITMRTGQVKFKREFDQIQKACSKLERSCTNTKRRINSEKFRIITLIGHDPFPPEASCDQILYPTSQPGFCYRCNGQPTKKFNSLVESQTRRIVHDMEGKLGLFPKPAANVVSDNPIMSEVLSSPEIVSILCDLRTTAALLEDPNLMEQFNTKFTYLSSLDPSSLNPLMILHNNKKIDADYYNGKKTGEEEEPLVKLNPIDYLKQYRKNLLQEFFQVFQEKAEIRLSTGLSRNAALRYLWAAPKNSVRMLSANERIVDINKPPISLNEWNEALISCLENAKQKSFRLKSNKGSSSNTSSKYKSSTSASTSASAAKETELNTKFNQSQLMKPHPEIIYDQSKIINMLPSTNKLFAPLDNKELLSEKQIKKSHIRFGGVQVQKFRSFKPNQYREYNFNNRKSSSDSESESDSSKGSSIITSNRIQMIKNPPLTIEEKIQASKRKEFDVFMKGLIKNIENVNSAKDTLVDIKHKNPSRNIEKFETLQKLLKKPSLFSQLTEDDLTFYEFEGGKAQVKKLLAKQLHEAHKLSPTYHHGQHHHLHHHHHHHHNHHQNNQTHSPTTNPNLTTATDYDEYETDEPSFGKAHSTLHRPTTVNSEFFKNYTNSPILLRPSDDTSTNTATTATSSRIESSGSGSTNSKNTGSDHNSSLPSTATETGPDATTTTLDEMSCLLNSKSSMPCSPNNKTFKRVCCQACKAKLHQACHTFRERDRKDQLQVQARFWKTPGIADDWARKSAPQDVVNSNLLLTNVTNNYSKILNNFPKSSDIRSSSKQHQFATAILSTKMSKYIPARIGTSKTQDKTFIGLSSTLDANANNKTPLLPGSKFIQYKSSPSKSILKKALENVAVVNPYASSSTDPNSGFGGKKSSKFSSSGGSSFKGSPILGDNDDFNNNNVDIIQQRRLRKLSNPGSWTLKVSKFDIMKLRYELEVETLSKKLQLIAVGGK